MFKVREFWGMVLPHKQAEIIYKTETGEGAFRFPSGGKHPLEKWSNSSQAWKHLQEHALALSLTPGQSLKKRTVLDALEVWLKQKLYPENQ